MAETHTTTINTDGTPPPAEGEEKTEELILGKFKDQDALAEGYKQLEQKLGQQGQQLGEKAAENQQAAITKAASEFAEKGELSEDIYSELSKNGLSKEIVDSYIAGQQASKYVRDSELQSVAEGNYDKVAEWASENLSDAELEAYNTAVDNPNVEVGKMAVAGLYAKFKAASPEFKPDNSALGGDIPGSSTGVKPFGSYDELKEAQKDPRYKRGDPAYHKLVDQRLAISKI